MHWAQSYFDKYMVKPNSSQVIHLIWSTLMISQSPLWPVSEIVNVHRRLPADITLGTHGVIFTNQFNQVCTQTLHSSQLLSYLSLIYCFRSLSWFALLNSLCQLYCLGQNHSQSCGKNPNICALAQWDLVLFMFKSVTFLQSELFWR